MAKQTTPVTSETDLIEGCKKLALETPYRLKGFMYTQDTDNQTLVITLQAPLDAQDEQQAPRAATPARSRQVPKLSEPETHYSAFTIEEDGELEVPLNGATPTEVSLLDRMVAATEEEVEGTELTAENAASIMQRGVVHQQEKLVRQPQDEKEKFYDDTVLNAYFNRAASTSNIGIPEEE